PALHSPTLHDALPISFQTTGRKKRTGFGPHPESEHPGQMRLECRSRTAISCDSRERREQHFRRPAEKADRFWKCCSRLSRLSQEDRKSTRLNSSHGSI